MRPLTASIEVTRPAECSAIDVQAGHRDAAQVASPVTRRELGLAWTLALLVAAAFVIHAAVHGALGAARSDDWAYYRITFDLADTGRFHLDNWTQAMLIGQSVLAVPIIKVFGHSIVALQITVALAGSVGLVLAYLVLRRFLGWRAALFSTAILPLGPIYGSIAVSFMTDVPAFTAQMAALYFAVRAFERSTVSIRWFIASLAAGILAFSIREYGAAAVLATSLMGLRRARMVRRHLSAVVCAVAAASFGMGVMYWWRHSLPGTYATPFKVSRAQLQTVATTTATLAALLIPLLFVISPIRVISVVWRRSRLACIIVPGVVALLERGQRSAFVGNYLTADAVAGVLPGRGWKVLLLAGMCCEILLILVGLISWMRIPASDAFRGVKTEEMSTTPLVGVYVAAGVVGQLSLLALVDTGEFDRYLVPFVPLLAGLVLVASQRIGALKSARASLVWAIAGGCAFATVGFAGVDRIADLDGSMWRAGERLVAQGYDPSTIDAGYAWFGYHQRLSPQLPLGEVSTYHDLFPFRVICVSVEPDAEARPGSAGAQGRSASSTGLTPC